MEVDVHHGVSTPRQETTSRRPADQVQHVVEMDVLHGERPPWLETSNRSGSAGRSGNAHAVEVMRRYQPSRRITAWRWMSTE